MSTSPSSRISPQPNADADTERGRIVTVGARLYAKGLIAAGDGNISARVERPGGAPRWWITASGTHKGFLGLEDILAVDVDGTPQDTLGSALRPSSHRPSSEWSLHAACYAERPDCGAVVHAHPPTVIALALAGVSLEDPVLSEAALVLGRVPVAPYATPTTAAVGETLRPFVRQANAVVLAHHGALCLGRTVDEAWRRMETLEHTALVIWRARVLGPVAALPAEEVARLRDLAGRLGM